MTDIRIIKKYPNRRLYDTEQGTYITLDDVKKLVYDHVHFQVIDVRTKKDLTQSTLLQIIAEQEATTTPIFTTGLLQNIIRTYQKNSQSLFTQYLEQTMELFLRQKSFLQNQWFAYQQLLSNPAALQQALKLQNTKEKDVKSSDTKKK